MSGSAAYNAITDAWNRGMPGYSDAKRIAPQASQIDADSPKSERLAYRERLKALGVSELEVEQVEWIITHSHARLHQYLLVTEARIPETLAEKVRMIEFMRKVPLFDVAHTSKILP